METAVWRPFFPNALQALPIFALAQFADNGDPILFFRIYNFEDDSHLSSTGQLLQAEFTPDGREIASLQITDSRNEEFISRETNNGYGWVQKYLANPEILEQIVSKLSELTGDESFALCTNGTRVNIVCRLREATETAMFGKKKRVIAIGICPAGGPHQLAIDTIAISSGGVIHKFGKCERCHSLVWI